MCVTELKLHDDDDRLTLSQFHDILLNNKEEIIFKSSLDYSDEILDKASNSTEEGKDTFSYI